MVKKDDEKSIARDIDALIASEKLFQTFRELQNAGFTDHQAMMYLSNLIGYITVNKKK